MPANNSKLMSDILLKKIKDKYVVEYDAEQDEIVVGLTTCKRKTIHSRKEPFHINSKKPKRKICFSMTVIDLFIDFQSEESTKDITIFDVQNAVIELKIMYQKITKISVLNLIRKKFEGIKKI